MICFIIFLLISQQSCQNVLNSYETDKMYVICYYYLWKIKLHIILRYPMLNCSDLIWTPPFLTILGLSYLIFTPGHSCSCFLTTQMDGLAQTDNSGNFSAQYSIVKDVIFRIQQACVIFTCRPKMRGWAVASWERAVV